MWEIEVSIVSGATRKAIWRLWTDVARRDRWDDAIEMSDLEGSFAVGAQGRLRPKEMPQALSFTLTDVKPLEAFTDITELPGATIAFSHRVAAAEGGTRLTHRAQIGGPEWQRYAQMLGENLATGVSRAVAKLAQLAEAESR